MNFGQAVSNVFHKYATFTGRARRSEYWWFAIFNYLVGAVIGGPVLITAIQTGAQHSTNPALAALQSLVSLIFFIPALAVTWRRLHDTGRSGAWMLLTLVPIFGWIALVVLLAKDGDRGPNQYGLDPKTADI